MVKQKRSTQSTARQKILNPNLEKASAHLKLAHEQWEKAAVHSWEPSDPAQCVSLAFYAYENAVVAAAEAHGSHWTKKHYEKADLAAKLAIHGPLKTNVHDRLDWLNNLRKGRFIRRARRRVE